MEERGITTRLKYKDKNIRQGLGNSLGMYLCQKNCLFVEEELIMFREHLISSSLLSSSLPRHPGHSEFSLLTSQRVSHAAHMS